MFAKRKTARLSVTTAPAEPVRRPVLRTEIDPLRIETQLYADVYGALASF